MCIIVIYFVNLISLASKMVGSAGFEPAVTSDLASYCPEARMLTKLHHNPGKVTTLVFQLTKRIVGFSFTRFQADCHPVSQRD